MKSKYETAVCDVCRGAGTISGSKGGSAVPERFKCMKCQGSGSIFSTSNTFSGSTLVCTEVLEKYAEELENAEIKGFEEGYAQGTDDGMKTAEDRLGTMAGMVELLKKRVGDDEALLKRLSKHLNKHFDCELRFKS